MQYRPLGETGLIGDAWSLGRTQFGSQMNMGSPDHRAAAAMIDSTVDMAG